MRNGMTGGVHFGAKDIETGATEALGKCMQKPARAECSKLANPRGENIADISMHLSHKKGGDRK